MYNVTEDSVFLIKQLVKVSLLILFSELFLYQTFNLQDAIHHTKAQVPWHLLISISCAEKATRHIFFFILYLLAKKKNGKKNWKKQHIKQEE